MSAGDRSLVHPAAVPGWWLDHRLGEVGGAEMHAARRAVAIEPGDVAEYATVLLARSDDHARVALELLGPEAVAAEAVRVAIGPDAALALVLPATVVPPAGAAPPRTTSPERSQPAADPTLASPREIGPVDAPGRRSAPRRAPRRTPATSDDRGRRASGSRVAAGIAVALLVVAGGRALRSTSTDRAQPAAELEAWDAATATATVRHGDRVATYVLGAPGDQLLLGDWDGNGVRTPALYRTSTGEVWAFDRWAGDGEAADARALATHPPGGTPRVERDGDRETVVVDPPAR